MTIRNKVNLSSFMNVKVFEYYSNPKCCPKKKKNPKSQPGGTHTQQTGDTQKCISLLIIEHTCNQTAPTRSHKATKRGYFRYKL